MPLSLTVFYLLIDNPAVHQSQAEVGDDIAFALRGIFDLPLEFPLVPRTRFDEPSAAQVSPAAQQSLLTILDKIARVVSGAAWNAKRAPLSDLWPVRQLNRM